MNKLLVSLCASLLSVCAFAQVPYTTISDTLPPGNSGAAVSGSINISWTQFTYGIYTVAQSPVNGVNYSVTAGAVSIPLAPTDHTGSGVLYRVVATISGSAVTTYWQVPTLPSPQCASASFCTIKEVTIAFPTSPSAIINPSQISTTGGLNSQVICNVSGIVGWCDANTGAVSSTSLPLTITDGVLSIPAATTSQNGYLTSVDWARFNAKQATITTGTTLQYIDGTLALQTFPLALPPNGSAAGDLSGTYPNPGVATVDGSTAANVHAAELLANAATNLNIANAIVKRDGSGNFAASTVTAALSGNASTATALAALPTPCSSGSAPTGILANGNSTGCASLAPISGATTNAIVTAGSATSIQTPSAGATVDSSGNIVVNSVTTATSGSVAGGYNFLEGVAPSGVASNDLIYAVSASHRLAENANNAGQVLLSGIASAGVSGNCVELAANGIDLIDAGAVCGSGVGTTFEVNGTGLASSSTVNFLNSAAFNGLTATFTNPSAGGVQLGFSGTLGNAGLTNSTIGLTGLPAWLTGGSAAALGANISLTATTGLTANQFLGTPNGSTGAVGLRSIVAADIPTLNQSTTGNAATATALAALPMPCSSGSAPTGILANGNSTGCASLAPISGATTNAIVTASSATSIQTPSAGATVDSSGDLVANSVTTATSGSVAGGYNFLEGVAPSGVASNDLIYADSTAHRLTENANNAGQVLLSGIASAGVAGNCPQFATNGIDIVDSGSTNCGGTPALAFSAITSGTNVNTLAIGTGGTLGPTGTGLVSANLINSAAIPASALLLGTNSSKQTIAAVLASGDFYIGNVSNLPVAVAMSGDATLTNTGAVTLATVNSGPGSCGDATHLCQVTTNGKGLVTAQSAVAITAGDLSAIIGVAGGGTANAQTVTLVPAVAALTSGLTIKWLPTAANTSTTVTVSLNGLGAAALDKQVAGAPAAVDIGDLSTTIWATATYDGTEWILQNPINVWEHSSQVVVPVSDFICFHHGDTSFTFPGTVTACNNLTTDPATNTLFNTGITIPANTLKPGRQARICSNQNLISNAGAGGIFSRFYVNSVGVIAMQAASASWSPLVNATSPGAQFQDCVDVIATAALGTSANVLFTQETTTFASNAYNIAAYLQRSGTQPLAIDTTIPNTFYFGILNTATGLASGTYTSGITATGSTAQTCTLATFNNGNSGGTATVALTGTNTIAGGTALVITNTGNSSTSAATSATASSGTATCSGTATVATVLGGSQGAGLWQQSLYMQPIGN